MKVILVLILTCELCWTISVPVTWDDSESDKSNKKDGNTNDFFVESIHTQGESSDVATSATEEIINQKPIPLEYFQYTARKPQFAVDIGEFHGVQSPENYYKAYPIQPYTREVKPNLGKHHILDGRNTIHKELQGYAQINDDGSQVEPLSSSYEVYHPYKAETPALKDIYRDPVLMKIRNDLENSKNRLQQYEKEAGEPNVSSEEYLEPPKKTEAKLFPHRHPTAPFEIHRPLRRPNYYQRIPVHKNRERYLNQRFRHPWNQNIAKVRPIHYQPIQNHIQQLRHHHALKYDDERNEYPQVQVFENNADPKDGQDIYERGSNKFNHLRNNVDESINRAVQQNRPTTYQKLEMQNDDSFLDEEDDETEFIPIKNYAQVRKTEKFKHLPRSAAFDDADSYDEIKNAPRLREAVKSTKAQTVYSEEGYEDGAYDHAGEQKHAFENEGHGGFLKEHEHSSGKYKTPSVAANYEDGEGSINLDQEINAEKWKDEKKETKEDEEISIEKENEYLLNADNHQDESLGEQSYRNKREDDKYHSDVDDTKNNGSETSTLPREVDKREVNIEVPQIDLNSTFFSDKEFLRIAKLKLLSKKDSLKQKYPYYFKNLKSVNKNSPLRYAENLKFIPKKSKGGTEFYDSRSMLQCPDVDDVPDPVPEKLKGDGHPDDNNDNTDSDSSTQGEENFDTAKKQPRLKGLGDKIDCFKAKFFGENPLDNPFFKEDIISNPEPLFLHNISPFKLKTPIFHEQKGIRVNESKSDYIFNDLRGKNPSNLFNLIQKLKRNDQNSSLNHKADKNNTSSRLEEQSSVYNDVIKNIKNTLLNSSIQNHNVNKSGVSDQNLHEAQIITYSHFKNKEDVTQSPYRKKRAALYEPYKIIRDSSSTIQFNDNANKTSSKTNIGPVLRKLRSSKVPDRATQSGSDEGHYSKRNINTRAYKDIGKKERDINYGSSKNDRSSEDSEIVDVNVGKKRGEPRYEMKHLNHKSRYVPVTNTKAMSREDYEAQVKNVIDSMIKTSDGNRTGIIFKQRTLTEKPISKNEKIKDTGSTAKKLKFLKSRLQDEDDLSAEDITEYEEEQEESVQLTKTMTQKPFNQHKIYIKTTTPEPVAEPILKLVTRFRDYNLKELTQPTMKKHEEHRRPTSEDDDEIAIVDESTPLPLSAPKFKEKKKKLTKSTIVTDSKTYGNTSGLGRKEIIDEVDAIIGDQQSTGEFLPLYRKGAVKEPKETSASDNSKSQSKERKKENTNDSIENWSSEEIDDESEEEEGDDSEEEYDDVEEDRGNENLSDSSEYIEDLVKTLVTTPEPIKRTLIITTETPISTSASHSAKTKYKPRVLKKRIEIHNELPVNNSSPHISEFKQDIKQIEIIKDSDRLQRHPDKNVEFLELYKDENLAKDINNMGVEIFKANLDLKQGPKHGGNYKNIETITPTPKKHSKIDAVASQTKQAKKIELDHEENGKSTSKLNSKGNTSKHHSTRRNQNRNDKSQKFIELDDEHDDSSSEEDQGYSSKSQTPMHGGNYRSAKLTEKASTEATTQKDIRHSSASILNTFVQVSPVLSSKALYILDPSKRKYYYVDV